MDSAEWLEHFRDNRTRAAPPVPARIDDVPAHLRAPLVRSLQRFQLGETGEGTLARQVVASHDPALDDDTRSSIALWVREEGQHAAQLAKVLRALGAQPIARHFSQSWFRRARRLLGYGKLGLHAKLVAVTCAEVVGLVVYRLVRDHGQSPTLSSIAAGLVDDERAHLEFLHDFFERSIARSPAWARGAHRVALRAAVTTLLSAAVATIVVDQRSFLDAIAVGPRRFAEMCFAEVAALGVDRSREDRSRVVRARRGCAEARLVARA